MFKLLTESKYSFLEGENLVTIFVGTLEECLLKMERISTKNNKVYIKEF